MLRYQLRSPKHRPIEHWLRSWYRSISVAHHTPGYEATFDDYLGLDPKECRLPQDEIGELACFNRADVSGNAMRDRGIDRVFGNVAFHAKVVVAARIPRPGASLHLYLQMRPP